MLSKLVFSAHAIKLLGPPATESSPGVIPVAVGLSCTVLLFVFVSWNVCHAS